MGRIYDNAFFDDSIAPITDARLSIASSAVMYGLSVYTVFPVNVTAGGDLVAFRLDDHYRRILASARIIGIDTFEPAWPWDRFEGAVRELVASNPIRERVFVRATVHVTDLVPGTRSRGLSTILSMFVYEAVPILPQDGARLKTSVWRRIPDYAIPSRAKVNGAYVNSVLAKQDAIDAGYDDCIFLDGAGHVCELSAANIFIVRDGRLFTPDTAADILEGINRKTVLEVAAALGIPASQRPIDLTELYIADEVFASGTSAFIAPVNEVDARTIGNGQPGPITRRVADSWLAVQTGQDRAFASLLTVVGKVRGGR
jgi:branched-chain amino acid aminotransferase